jgi:hypothetical protein
VKLEEEDPETFELFIFWCYYQRFPSEDHHDSQELVDLWTCEDSDGNPMISSRFVDLYVFGDQYQVPELCRHTLDALFEHLIEVDDTDFPSRESVTTAWEKLPETSPLSRFLVDVHCHASDDCSDWESGGEYEYANSFLLAVLRRWAHIHGSWGECDVHHELDLCDYHDHENGKEKKACKTERKKE